MEVTVLTHAFCLDFRGQFRELALITPTLMLAHIPLLQCPSSGWSAGVHKLDSRPNGNTLVSGGPGQIEKHGPYHNGGGWPTVNYVNVPRKSNLPITLAKHEELGLQHPSYFGSEFGASVMSSFESMSPTLDPAHWSLHGGAAADSCSVPDPTNGFWKDCTGTNVMSERNYPCDNQIITYFGDDAHGRLDQVGPAAFKKQLYQCMLAQALGVKSDIENRRATNTFGILTWQLNEIWPTGGWVSSSSRLHFRRSFSTSSIDLYAGCHQM